MKHHLISLSLVTIAIFAVLTAELQTASATDGRRQRLRNAKLFVPPAAQMCKASALD